MTKDTLDKVIKSLEDKNIKFVLDTHIHDKSCVRGIFISDTDRRSIKQTIGSGIMKDIKIKKTYLWNLGEKKKALLLELKDELVLEIPEADSYGLSSTA